MQDIRVHRGADAASDHHLVLTKLKLKLKSRVERGNIEQDMLWNS